MSRDCSELCPEREGARPLLGQPLTPLGSPTWAPNYGLDGYTAQQIYDAWRVSGVGEQTTWLLSEPGEQMDTLLKTVEEVKKGLALWMSEHRVA